MELEDPSRYLAAATTVLQIPVPEVERKRPGGIGIADLQPFLRPSLDAQEEKHEWTGVTERMVDEVDESKRTSKVYDLRLEPSSKCLFLVSLAHRASESSFATPSSDLSAPPPQTLERRRYLQLAEAFVKWGGFASSSIRGDEAAGPGARPTLDLLIERAPKLVKTKWPSGLKEDEAPPVEEEPHKSFNYEFDEPVHSTDIQTPLSSQADKASPEKSQSLLIMQREGKRLSKKQKALLQAATISRTPFPNFEEKEVEKKAERESDGDEAAQGPRAEIDEERKQIHNRLWNLVRSKWF